MKFLLDTSPRQLKLKMQSFPEMIVGQLCTPLTRNCLTDDVPFAIDNGAFSEFNASAFCKTLEKHREDIGRCLFVTCPDVVGNARRTLEAFSHWSDILMPWPIALVAQDGIEDMDIPWRCISAIFIGGTTQWKDSNAAYDIVKTAKIIDCHVHVGRVNDRRRFNAYSRLGADTCDGTGVSIFTTNKLSKIEEANKTPLLN